MSKLLEGSSVKEVGSWINAELGLLGYGWERKLCIVGFLFSAMYPQVISKFAVVAGVSWMLGSYIVYR